MRYLIFAFFSLLTLFSVAQTTEKGQKKLVEGFVHDYKSGEPIEQATLRLLNATDSTYVGGWESDPKGRFELLASAGNYIIQISSVGYNDYYKNIDISDKQTEYKLGVIKLSENSILLNETVVEAKMPNIVVRGDTIEYNASAYSSDENDLLQDLIKNIAGIEIDSNGSLTANGKPIQKILVDGKEFFGNDIALALNNLPANMIKKIQLYKEDSETAKITGFKDVKPEQVLNLVVKEELKQSIFGNVQAGYGSDGKYSNKGMANYMHGESQTSLVGNMNNVNDDMGFAMNNGIDINKSVGVSTYRKLSEKLKIGGNIRYSNNKNIDESRTDEQLFIETGDRFSTQNSRSVGRRENINGGINLHWQPDTLTTIFMRTSLGFTNTTNEQWNSSASHQQAKDTTTVWSINNSKGDGFNLTNTLTIGRKLNSKGRTVSLTLNNSMRRDNTDGANQSSTHYGGNNPDKEINQKLETDNNANTYNASISYVEPLGKDYSLQLMYSINNSNSKRNRDTRKPDANGNFTLVDTAYSRNTKSEYTNQNINLSFQATKAKYRYTVGFSVEPTFSRSHISLHDSVIENVKQNVINFSPNFNFSYNPNSTTSLSFDYSGSTSQPTIAQLSGDTTITSAISKHYGNPDLKPSYENGFSMYYQKSDYETSRFFMIMAGFRYTFNNIVDYSIIDDLGNSMSSYRNVDGNMSANLGVTYDTPLRNKKLTFNTNTYTNYYKNRGFVNQVEAVTQNISLAESMSLKFKLPKLETNLTASVQYNIASNNLTDAGNLSTINFRIDNTIQLNLPYDFSIRSNISFTSYSGYGSDFKKSEALWNGSIAKTCMKKKKGTVRLQFFDILNDRTNLSRSVTSSGITDSRTNTVSRYFLASFAYRFNILKGKKGDGDAGVDDDF